MSNWSGKVLTALVLLLSTGCGGIANQTATPGTETRAPISAPARPKFWPQGPLTIGSVAAKYRQMGLSDARETGEVIPALFGATAGGVVSVGRQNIQVYVFGTEAEAEKAAKTASDPQAHTVEWAAKPHIIAVGNLAITIITNDEDLAHKLEAWLRECPPPAPAPQQEEVVLPPLQLSDIAHVRVHTRDPQVPVYEATGAFLENLPWAWNGHKIVRPRDEATTPDFTVDITLTSGKLISLSRVEGRPLMAAVDGRNLWIESAALTSVVTRLGSHLESAPAQDLWVVAPADALAGRREAGRFYSLRPTAQYLQISPDGVRALLHAWDTSQSRVTYPTWVEEVTLATGERRLLTPQSDWWGMTGWLPDGRVFLAGAKVWLSDPAGGGLKELMAPGGSLGAARDRGYHVAWAYSRGTKGEPSPEFGISVLNLETGKTRDYPGPYLKASVNPKSGVPLLFSPDGSSLAFLNRNGDSMRLMALDLQTGQLRPLMQGEWYPVDWGESGLWAWQRPEPSDKEGTLVRLNSKGEEQQRVKSPSPGRISPDGLWMAVSRYSQASVIEPGLLQVETGEIRWLEAQGYQISGWTSTGELVLLQQPPRQ